MLSAFQGIEHISVDPAKLAVFISREEVSNLIGILVATTRHRVIMLIIGLITHDCDLTILREHVTSKYYDIL